MRLNELIEMFRADDNTTALTAASKLIKLSKIEGGVCQIDDADLRLQTHHALKALEASLVQLPTLETLTVKAGSDLFSLRIGPLPVLKRLFIEGLTPTLCAELAGFIDDMPNLERIELDRPVSLELWKEIQRAPRLVEFFDEIDEEHALSVSYGERLLALIESPGEDYDTPRDEVKPRWRSGRDRTLLSDSNSESEPDEDQITQAIELMMHLEGHEDGVTDVLGHLLEGGVPQLLQPGRDLIKRMGNLDLDLVKALYAGLLKVTGEWRRLDVVTLRVNLHLINSALYHDVGHLKKLNVLSSSVLTELGPLTSLTHLEVSRVDALDHLSALMDVAPLKCILTRDLSIDLLAQLPAYPKLFDLIERGAQILDPLVSRHDTLQELLNQRYPDMTSVSVERLTRLGSAICGQAGEVTRFQLHGVSFRMIYCPSGQFTITRLGSRRMRRSNRLVEHDCHLSRPYWIGQMPVTQALWEVVTGERPSYFKDEVRPVERVNWFDCVRFCNALSVALGLEPVYEIGVGDKPEVSVDLTRRGFRLPTGAEWEYAALGGETPADFDLERINQMAWSDENAADETRPVGLRTPNSWGVYDIFGNVSEWCSDELQSIARYRTRAVLFDPHEWDEGLLSRSGRGGHWNASPLYFSPTNDQAFKTHTRGFNLGLRLAKTI